MPATIVPHVLLRYRLTPDYVERRAAWRDEHLALLNDYRRRGAIAMAGALTGPVDEAIIVFAGAELGPAEAFARADPYVRSGLVLEWEVRHWSVVE